MDSTTRLSGNAALGSAPEFPVKATSITRSDSKKSDGSVAVFEHSSCLVKDEGDPPNCVAADDPQERLITASIDKFATDRKTGMAVQDRKYVSADAGEHKGLINKFPFQTQKQAYAFWDGTAGKAINAVYKGTSILDGLETSRLRGAGQRQAGAVTDGITGTYTTAKPIWVEPLTGTIINQVNDQSRATDRGQKVLTLKLGFTDKQVKANVKERRPTSTS